MCLTVCVCARVSVCIHISIFPNIYVTLCFLLPVESSERYTGSLLVLSVNIHLFFSLLSFPLHLPWYFCFSPLCFGCKLTALKRLPFMRTRSKEKDKEKAIYRRSMCKTSNSPPSVLPPPPIAPPPLACACLPPSPSLLS